MIAKYSQYLVPGLGVCCAVGVVMVGTAMHTPMRVDADIGDTAAYEAEVPENLELAQEIPTMELVVEKHLFVKERKATGANTFPDLLIKGVYVGEKQSVVLSLKSKPEINLRVWLDDIDGVINRISDPRDPRRPIVDFLNEWDLKEVTFAGVTVEHFITGEVETYKVDYTPEKHAKDNAGAGYGQGVIAEASPGVAKTSAKKPTPPATTGAQAAQQRAQAMFQLRRMVEQMTPEQRAQMAERIRGGGGRGNSAQNQDSRSGAKSGAQKSSAGGKKGK